MLRVLIMPESGYRQFQDYFEDRYTIHEKATEQAERPDVIASAGDLAGADTIEHIEQQGIKIIYKPSWWPARWWPEE